MAIASPVLERRIDTVTPVNNAPTFDYSQMSEDEIHNAKIKDNYARLINADKYAQKSAEPVETESALNVRSSSVYAERGSQMSFYEPSYTAYAKPENEAVNRAPSSAQNYRVENARASAAVFRADSPINRVAQPVLRVAPVIDEAPASSEEEENEDLRPTATTIQYKTVDKYSEAHTGTKSNGLSLSKKEKITIAAFIGVVVMLFALIIINAAIISGLSADIGVLEASLSATEQALSVVNESVAQAVSPEKIISFATENGMILAGGN